MSEINNEKKEKLKELLGSELVEKVYANLGNRLIEDMSIDKVDKIVQVFKEQGLSLEIIEKCSSILVWGNENEIREILKVLDEKGIGRDILKTNGKILATGKAKEIEKILDFDGTQCIDNMANNLQGKSLALYHALEQNLTITRDMIANTVDQQKYQKLAKRLLMAFENASDKLGYFRYSAGQMDQFSSDICKNSEYILHDKIKLN